MPAPCLPRHQQLRGIASRIGVICTPLPVSSRPDTVSGQALVGGVYFMTITVDPDTLNRIGTAVLVLASLPGLVLIVIFIVGLIWEAIQDTRNR